MKRYSEYKDSGVQWIGKIPSHWKILRAKNMFKKEKRSIRPEDEVITCFRDGQVTLRKNRRTTGFTESFTECGYQGIRKGDLVIHQMDAFAGSIGVSDSDGKGTSVYHCCTPKGNFDTQYYASLIRIMAYSGYIQSLYRGIRERSSDFKFPVFGNQNLAVPPFTEQQAIVDYLKVKTSKIEQYVTERERERELLESLKQSEIANVVTRGLNPNVPMKDSGIPWIGMIPEHWEVRKLRHFIKLVSIKGYGDKTLLSVTREQGVIQRNIESKEENHNFIPDDLNGYKLVMPGQFVINKMKSWQGSYGVSDYEGIVSPAYYVCNLEFPCKEYFSMAIRSKAYVPFFTQYSKGIRVDQWDLSPIGLKNIPFIVPPLSEQQAIVDYIKTRLTKIDSYIADLQAEIDYLKEFKQRLVSDVVTGQICVAEPQKGDLR